MLQNTCVVEECGDEGAVSEEGVAGGNVLKVAFLKQRVFEHHGLHSQVHEPSGQKMQLGQTFTQQMSLTKRQKHPKTRQYHNLP